MFVFSYSIKITYQNKSIPKNISVNISDNIPDNIPRNFSKKNYHKEKGQDDFYTFLYTVPSTKKLEYFEEFYNLYYLTSYYNNKHLKRNIFWLQQTLKKPFAPPIQALVISTNENQYLRYQRLMKMHVNYLLTKNYVFLAARFDKHYPVFFNKKYSRINLKSLEIAEYYYKIANLYWQEAMKHYQKGNEIQKKTELMFVEDLFFRIKYEKFNYSDIINRKISNLKKKKDYFNKK